MRLFALLFLTACAASPLPGMAGARMEKVSMNGRAYTLWYTQTRVEIVRHGWANPGDHQQIRADMIALIPQVTGCTLSEPTLTGDSGEMRASLRC